MFSDKKILVLGKFAGLTAASTQKIKEKTEENQGQTDVWDPKMEFQNKYTHIIVPPHSTPETIQKKLGVDNLEQVKATFITPDWVHTSLSKGEPQSESLYVWSRSPRQKENVVTSKRGKTPTSTQNLPMQGISKGRGNLNKHLTDQFEKLEKHYRSKGETGRAIGYNNIVRTIKTLPFTVTSVDQIRNIEGIGQKTLQKVEEVLKSGELSRVEELESDTDLMEIEELTQVHGIGSAKAKELHKKGIHSLHQLKDYSRKHPAEFTQTQQMAIGLVEDFQQKIPREETEQIAQLIKKHTHQLDPQAHVETGGSYRRGETLSKDLDFVIASEHYSKVLPSLIKKLSEINLITHTFTEARKKYMGVCKLHGKPHRRLDIYMCKKDELPYAILYFSGSKDLNQMMRKEAKRRGMKLTSTGLYDAKGKPALKPRNENEICRYLGFPDLTPQMMGV